MTYAINTFAYADDVNYAPGTATSGQSLKRLLLPIMYIPHLFIIGFQRQSVSAITRYWQILQILLVGKTFWRAMRQVVLTLKPQYQQQPSQFHCILRYSMLLEALVINAYFSGEIEDGGEDFEGGGKVVTIPTEGMKPYRCSYWRTEECRLGLPSASNGFFLEMTTKNTPFMTARKRLKATIGYRLRLQVQV